jgi:hypothetical protein
MTSFVWLGAPRGDDPSLIRSPVGVDHSNFQSIHYPNGIHAYFATVESVIHSFDSRAIENPRGILKRDAME